MDRVEYNLDAIVNLAKDSIIQEVDGKIYANKQFSLIRNIDRFQIKEFSSLESFIEFANLYTASSYVSIGKEYEVILYNLEFYEDGRLFPVAVCKCVDFDQFPFGKMISAMDFQIKARSLFVANEDLTQLFSITKTIDLEDGVKLADNGLSMDITVRRGISVASVDQTTINTIRKLRPYRIFPEVEQPESEFLLRMAGSREDGLSIGLYEADGGAWRIVAATNIKNYLKEKGLSNQISIYY